MKKLSIFCGVMLLTVAGAFGADIVTATIAVTNAAGTTNGQTITVNANVRTWTNSVVVPASQILTNATAGGSASNLFNQISGNPYSGLSLARSGTNGITLQTVPGGALSVTLSANWGTVTLSTNTLTAATVVRVPVTVEAAAAQTNVASGLVAALNLTAATNSLNPAAPAMAMLLGTTNTQTVSGAKSFTNAAGVWGGRVVSTNITGTVSNLAYGTLSTNAIDRPSITNGTFYGQMVFPVGSEVSIKFESAVTDWGIYEDSGVLVFTNYDGTVAFAGDSINIGSGYYYGDGNYLSNTTAKAVLNGSMAGTNNFPSGSDVSFGRYAITSLANGNNAAVAVGTNVFVEVSGPTGAFAINGIAGGRDGKLLIILNQTGQNMTVAHDSGVDPTAGNRIYCMTGADRATTANGAATLIYSGTASRWILISIEQ